ncbi:MAG: molybdopterin-binding protein [Peptococcaceae bacterium]|nr:molybdopterin-binding protein [Peptococcaceae bacterium]
MKQVRTEDAVGSVLCHDITKIVPGEFKGRAFTKGHIIRPEDVAELLKLGKEHLYVWEYQEGMLHEDQAAERLAKAVAGQNVQFSEVHEGRINLQAKLDGLCLVDRSLVERINGQEQIILATRHNNTLVRQGEIIAGTRVVPLVIDELSIKSVELICRGRVALQVLPLHKFSVGLVTTGSEVFKGSIKDAFGPVLKTKFADLGSQVVSQVFVPDDLEQIKDAILAFVNQGVDMVAVSGGMSVDPDDLTPGAIKASGAEIVGYGAPVLPGSQFLLAYIGRVPVVGLPGCVMYAKATVFDMVLPRLLAGIRLSKDDLITLGYGGLCLQCPECRYPVCPFGKS